MKASSSQDNESPEVNDSQKVIDSPEVDSSKVVDSLELVEYASLDSVRPKKRRKVASRSNRNHTKSVIPKGSQMVP